MYNWVNEFKGGHTSTRDKPRSRRPVETAMPEIIEKVHDMILNDRRVKEREIVEAIGISHGRVITILHEKLSIEKLLTRGVPRLLTTEHKRKRVTDSMAGSALFRQNLSGFLRWHMTVDGISIHFYTPKTKE